MRPSIVLAIFVAFALPAAALGQEGLSPSTPAAFAALSIGMIGLLRRRR